MRFTDKVVLVTGARSGIGMAAAVRFARAGARVAVNIRRVIPGETTTLELVQQNGAVGINVVGDVSVEADAQRMVAETVQAFGRVDILVNNAGIVLPGRVDNMSGEDFDKTMNVNVKGAFLMSRYTVPVMKKNGGGVIVNVASVAALKGIVDRSIYSASKGALVSLTRAMAIDYIRDNIRVNCVCPGTTYTEALEEKMRIAGDPEKIRAEFIARQPMGRLGTAEEIAQAILFACCDEAAYMNGSIITIDGGATI